VMRKMKKGMNDKDNDKGPTEDDPQGDKGGRIISFIYMELKILGSIQLNWNLDHLGNFLIQKTALLRSGLLA
jgi:hypothetical protein